jgi:microcin C transport system substrate-binding protein
LLEAMRLFKAAGYEVRNQRLVDSKTGEPYAVEFLSDNPNFERVFLFYQPSLERLGINVTVRTVDVSQYENRLRTWDFDIITATWGETLSPGNEQRGYWGSQAADQPGSRNLIGIKNPPVDAMINEIIFAKSRRLGMPPHRISASDRDGQSDPSERSELCHRSIAAPRNGSTTKCGRAPW